MSTMWRVIRIICAAAVLLLFVAGFANLTNRVPAAWEHAIVRVQLVPALISALNGAAYAMGILLALVLLTLIFGRVYCSFICPLGIMQDIVIRLRRMVDRLCGKERKGAVVRYARPAPWLRYSILALVAVSMLGGVSLLLGWLDPYTIIARFAAGVLNPLSSTIANMLDSESYAAPLWGRYCGELIVVALVLVPLGMAWWRGRLYCNTLCPVGALLSLLSRRPLLRIRTMPDACTMCGNCLRACKANCIDLKNKRVDTSRCVNCYNCVSACPNGLRPRLSNPLRSYAKAQPKANKPESVAPSAARRAFLRAVACGIPAALVACKRKDAAFVSDNPAELGDNVEDEATPPGSRRVDRFLDYCTGCGLCITACPTHVLQPSFTQHGFLGLMRPYLDFEEGFCNFDCTICGDVCPHGAIMPLDLAEKKHTQIALAAFHRERCIVQQDRTECGACTEHCPTKALYTVEEKFPACDASACYACNACLQTCPQKAISLITETDGSVHAHIDNSKCKACGKCARVCPSGAMSVRKLLIPKLAPELCIGCGACSYACPARPERAMQITPRARHLRAEVHREAPAQNPFTGDDFPF